MAEAITQEGRILKISSSAFDDDYLLLQSIELVEAISELPQAECVVLHDETREGGEPTLLDVGSILGQPVNIFFTADDGAARVYHGIVNSCSQMDRDRRFTYYKLTVVPAVWLLTQTVNSRIFQHTAIPQVLEQVLADYPIDLQLGSVEWNKRNYIVQYRESDFNFAARLMEEEGIYYYFKHEENSHKMVICVDQQSHAKLESKFEIPYLAKIEEDQPVDATHIKDLAVQYRLQTGKVTFWDFTHQKPTDTFESIETTRYQFAQNDEKAEHYLFPSGSIRKYDAIDVDGSDRDSELQNMTDDIKRNALLMQEAIDVRHRTITAAGNCPALIAGHRFKLVGHPTSDMNNEYVVTSIRHSAVQSEQYYPDMPDGEYKNEFECISWGQGASPFRPQRVTPKPMILAAQTATVVGKEGEEIYTDKYGRVKVQFHWDREGPGNEGSSCWVRVAQLWAGNRWGAMFIPRIGMEVLVHFLEGDPDQPIITGCVYNQESMPPYELPEEQTKSGIKSDSSLGGKGFNEWRFEDKKGEEQIFMHGEMDMDIRVKNDRREWTGKDQHLIVQEDLLEKIGYGDKPGSHHLSIKEDQKIKIEGGHHLNVGGDENIEVAGTQSVKVKTDQGINVGQNHSTEAGMALYLKGGTNVVIEAGIQLSLKAGACFIDLGPAGISISGPLVNINSGGAAGNGSAVPICPPAAPEDPAEADNAEPGQRAKLLARSQKRKEKKSSKEDPKKKSWIEIELCDEEGNPCAGEPYEVKTPDGKLKRGTLNNKGLAKVKGIDPGNCEVTFPKLDKGAWKDK